MVLRLWPASLMIKTHQWICNSKEIANELTRRLTPEQRAFTQPVAGRDTQRSGHYCDGLVNAILTGLKKEAQIRDPSRFARQQRAEVFYAQPAIDRERWNYVLDQLESRFQNTNKRPFNLKEDDELYGMVASLAPWQLTRIQVAWTPMARRLPMDVPLTHRGAALRSADGELIIESEDLSSINYPKQRFLKSMRLGLFFFGVPD